MLCCLCPDPQSDQISNPGVSPFPGQRRPVVDAPAKPAETLVVNVVIPAGMKPGQTIQVAAPDGSRTVSATIPPGLLPGESFFVSFPKHSHTSSSQSTLPTANQPIYTPAAAPVMPPLASPLNTQADLLGAPFSQALDGPPFRRPQQSDPPALGQQKLLLVNVPPGSAPGSTLYVQVPGENRTLAAKVPEGGVTQFHVAYQPKTTATSAFPTPIPTTNTNGQKLILVRVPPGTAPGTTLHVEAPDEPGRILAAQVPPNVSEFQVAYIPRNNDPIPAYDVPVRPPGGGGTAIMPYIGGAALAGAAGLAMYDHYHHHHHAAYQGYDGYADTYCDPGAYDYGGDYDGGYSEF